MDDEIAVGADGVRDFLAVDDFTMHVDVAGAVEIAFTHRGKDVCAIKFDSEFADALAGILKSRREDFEAARDGFLKKRH